MNQETRHHLPGKTGYAPRWRRSLFLICALVFVIPGIAPAQDDKARIVAAAEKAVARAIASAPKQAPGCSVGVGLRGETVLLKGFGIAELENLSPIRADSIFESGSIAKQFTAAALVLLEEEGKLDIDDQVRKYIPELPDYNGKSLTIRHLLNHTAGLRDWGAVMGLTGVGRGERIVRQNYALHVVTKQQGLDFIPGAEYSYSNSGYTLASTIVERVSGKSLPEFTKERIFDPVGMTDTSWRDDYERLIPGRVQAYVGPPKGPWKLSMPFMNVYGNGGILTTSADFLKWNAALDSAKWRNVAEKLETQGVLNDGRKINYALGLSVSDYNGIRRVAHGGRTAGYVTYLVRFPEKSLSISVLCNAPFRGPARIAHSIVDEAFGPFPEAPKPEAKELSNEDLKKYVGYWRQDKTRFATRTMIDKKTGKLRAGGSLLTPLKNGLFQAGNGPVRFRFDFGPDGSRKSATRINGEEKTHYFAVEPWKPTADELKGLEGHWTSDEADTVIQVKVESGRVSIKLASLQEIPLVPRYKDHFSVGGSNSSVVWIERNAKGEIETLHVGVSRLRNMEFISIEYVETRVAVPVTESRKQDS